MTDTQENSDKLAIVLDVIDSSKINNLIINGRKITVESTTLADVFGRQHKSILKTIDGLIEDGTISQHEFVPRDYKKRGKEYRCYELNEAGFLKAMPFIGGRKSREGQKVLVDEFLRIRKQLEQLSKERETVAYQIARSSGKDSRKLLTDEIQKFICYAKNKGSSHADRYFSLITNAVHKSIISIDPKITQVRELLTTLQLSILSTAELLAAQTLNQYMEKDMPYKEVFKQVKASLNSLPTNKTSVLGG